MLLISSLLIFSNMNFQCQIKNITESDLGHIIHHNSVFSKDNKWIVYDGRLDDSKIGETSTIGVVNIETSEERVIYQTENQTQFGPGVGAASFSPITNDVIFIHGLCSADQEKPYSLSRRVGVGIDIDFPKKSFHYDARDIVAPFEPGSLRGGTHSHCWSGDGRLISFTYNDEFVDSDLRVVGVMIPTNDDIVVDCVDGNNNGKMYSAIVTDVVRNPKIATDEINKAFDECWVGLNGYRDSTGLQHPYAIAYQGSTLNSKGEVIIEIFIVNIDEAKILEDRSAVGVEGERPHVPRGLHSFRLSRTLKGLSDLRHWLRSSSDGQFIYALAKDDKDRNQIISCRTSTGEYQYLTDFDFSISSPINIDYKGEQIAFFADNKIYLYSLLNRILLCLIDYNNSGRSLIGAPVFSRDNTLLAFNHVLENDAAARVQISIVDLNCNY